MAEKEIELTTQHAEDDRQAVKPNDLVQDNADEHEMTLRDIVRNHPALIVWCFYYGMCAFGWGFDAQVNGAMLSVDSFRRDFGYVEDGTAVLPAAWNSAFTSISAVGQFFGGFISSWISDRVGRKKSLAIGIVIGIAGVFGEIFSTANVAFLISKLILGFALGFFLTLGPLCCSEISPVVLRGISTAGINFAIALGQLLSNAAIKGFSSRSDHWAYRAPFAIQFLFLFVLIAGWPFAPETPWYFVRKGQMEEARKSLQQLYGKDVDISVKLAAIRATVDADLALDEGNWSDCFKGVNLIRTGISVGVFACQHFVGIIFVLGYSTYFFELAGLPTSQSFSMGVGVTACGVLGNAVSWFVVNSYGRRPVFIQGMIVLTALLLLIGIMDVVPTSAAKWVEATATVVYAFVYFMTIGAMAYVILGETSSPALRAKTTACATALQAVFGVAVNYACSYMINPDEGNLEGKVGFVFGGLAIVATFGSWLWVPELKGRTFNEIDTMFFNRVPPRKMGSYVIQNVAA